MSEFKLVPFHDDSLEISSKIEISKYSINAFYKIAGDLSSLILPSKKKSIFANDLWKTTCFELFLFENSSDHYYEFNFSPSHEWCCYEFSSYRNKKCDVSDLRIQIDSDRKKDNYQMTVKLEFPNSITDYLSSPTAVTQTSKSLNYWAIRHVGDSPDFHHYPF